MVEPQSDEAPSTVGVVLPSGDRQLDALAELIRGAGGAVAEADVFGWADRLKVRYSSDTELQRRLTRTFEPVGYSRRQRAFEWREPGGDQAPVAEEPVSEAVLSIDLLEQWLRASADDRGQLGVEISGLARLGDSRSPSVQLARAIGAAPGAVDWPSLIADETGPQIVTDAVISRAPLDWVLGAAVRLPTKRAASARARLAELSEIERAELACEAIGRWTSTGSESGHAKQLRRLRAAIDMRPNQLLVSASLDAAVALAAEADRRSEIAALAGLAAEAEGDIVSAAVDRFEDPTQIRSVLTSLGEKPAPSATRVPLLMAAARSSNRSALFDPSVFAGFQLGELGEILSAEPMRELLAAGLDQHVREPVRRATPARFGSAVGTVADFPVLEPLMPVQLLSTLVRADEASARSTRSAVAELAEEAAAAERESEQERRASLEQELERLRQVDRDRDDELAEYRRRADEADQRYRHALGSSDSASAAELRQARLDVLRSMIEHAVRFTDAAVAAGSLPTMMGVVAGLDRDLASFGVQVVGRRGDVVPFDPTLHEEIGVEPGTAVQIVHPAYRVDDSVTPLRYGLTRQVQHD